MRPSSKFICYVASDSVRALNAIMLLALLVIAAPFSAYAQIQQKSDERVEATGNYDDIAFFSGDWVRLSLLSTDDVFGAGSDVLVERTTADHLFVAAGNVRVRDVELKDVIAAGGNLSFASGAIADDVVVAGGEVSFEPEFSIGGSAVLAGGNLRIRSPIGADLRAAAGTLFFDGIVAGNARLMGDQVTVGPNARIEGNLEYRSDKLTVQPGAFIGGERIALPPTKDAEFERWGKVSGSLLLGFFFAFVVGMAVLVLMVSLAAPGLMHASAQSIRQRSLRALGIGFLIAFGMPFILILLFMSVIGIPLALLLIAILIALTPISLAVTATFIGEWERRLIRKDTPPGRWEYLGWPILGILSLMLVGLLPIVGLFVWLVALIVGLGAAVERGGRALARAPSPVIQPRDQPHPTPGL